MNEVHRSFDWLAFLVRVFAIAGLAGLLAIPGADIPSGAAWALYGTDRTDFLYQRE